MLKTIKGEMDSNTIILGDFNTPLTPVDRSSEQKVNKETLALNDTIDQIDLIDIYRTFHLKVAEYTFFSSAHGTFSMITTWVTNQALENLRKLKSYQTSFMTTTL